MDRTFAQTEELVRSALRAKFPPTELVPDMPYRRFVAFNAIGGALWVISMTLAGFFLGQIEFVKKHIELMVIGIIVLSVLPAVIAYFRGGKTPPPAVSVATPPGS